MFDYVEGVLLDKGPSHAIIGNGGLGFHIEVPINACTEEKIGTKIKLFTHFLIARGEAPVLYGFVDTKQRRIFHSILAVSGIGPRLAMNILGTFATDELAVIIAKKDAQILSRVPKLGPKKARLLILELEGKLAEDGTESSSRINSEAEEALISLGYKVKEARDIIKEINQPNMSSQDLVKLALRNLTQKP